MSPGPAGELAVAVVTEEVPPPEAHFARAPQPYSHDGSAIHDSLYSRSGVALSSAVAATYAARNYMYTSDQQHHE